MTPQTLADLKAEYAAQKALAERARAIMQALSVIIEQQERMGSREPAGCVAPNSEHEDERPRRLGRGKLARIILDCLREKKGRVRDIANACEQNGITVSRSSISNSIARLQDKGVIRFSRKHDRWMIAAENPEILELQNDEGSATGIAEPSVINGGPMRSDLERGLQIATAQGADRLA